jgi:hypothetical protein
VPRFNFNFNFNLKLARLQASELALLINGSAAVDLAAWQVRWWKWCTSFTTRISLHLPTLAAWQVLSRPISVDLD